MPEPSAPTVEGTVPSSDGPQQVEVQLDRSNQSTTYVNAFHTAMNADELLLELGLNIGRLPGSPENRVRVELTDRLVLSYPTAKRLAGTLAQAITQYEQRFGEIKTDRQSG